MNEKSILRRQVRELKRQHSDDELLHMSTSICRKVVSSSEWKEANTVLLYKSLPDEVNTSLLLSAALTEGKKVVLPVVIDGENMELRRYTGPDSLRKGAYGIMEPTGEEFPMSQYRFLQLAVIPGMAFDLACHRLGRGKGYYDRLLPKLSNAHLLGICFPFQLLSEIPSEDHDVRMHTVIS